MERTLSTSEDSTIKRKCLGTIIEGSRRVVHLQEYNLIVESILFVYSWNGKSFNKSLT